MNKTTAPKPILPSESALAAVEREALDFYIQKHARERWWHEDNLVNQRTTWLLTTQGVLGAAFGYLQYRIAEVNAGLTTLVASDKEHYIGALGQFSRGIQIIGALTCIFILVSIVAAQSAQSRLQEQYSSIGSYSLGVSPETTKWGHAAGLAMPALCLLAWLLAFVLLK